MDYLQYFETVGEIDELATVLNLIINGLPSISHIINITHLTTEF